MTNIWPRRPANLDQQLLASMVKLAEWQGHGYISPFGTTYFFAYIDYYQGADKASYGEVAARVIIHAAQNIGEGIVSSTGKAHAQQILRSQ